MAVLFAKPDLVSFEDENGRVIWDGFPISEGHTLAIPKFHVSNLFDLEPETQAALSKMVSEVRSRLNEELQPNGFKI